MKLFKRVPTDRGVLVRIQGKEYVGYCNRCPWVAYRVRRNLGRAVEDAREHTCGTES